MSTLKMHHHELDIDVALVKQLLGKQFPQWADLPISAVQSAGTDNAIFQLGNEMCVRLPRIPEAASDVKKEQLWLPQLAPKLSLTIPIPLGKGCPEAHYPLPWSIYPWIEGKTATVESIAHEPQAAIDLAKFISSLQRINAASGPISRRGLPLASQDDGVRHALKSLHDKIDTEKARMIWEKTLKAPEWKKSPVWIHGDLLPTNLLVYQGKLSAVIDFGLMGIGDPACDLIPAWCVFSSSTRQVFRSTLAVDDATWLRGQGWALSIALIILPYYEKTNPGLVAIANYILNEILNDADLIL